MEEPAGADQCAGQNHRQRQVPGALVFERFHEIDDRQDEEAVHEHRHDQAETGFNLLWIFELQEKCHVE